MVHGTLEPDCQPPGVPGRLASLSRLLENGFMRVTIQPDDEFNRALVQNVHPPDWVNPEPADRYNLVVLGAGTAGLVTAAGAAGLGARVALVEKHLLGGDCLNVGCVPSKALIRASRACAQVRDAAAFGIRIKGDVDCDFGAAMTRLRKLRALISRNDSVIASPRWAWTSSSARGA